MIHFLYATPPVNAILVKNGVSQNLEIGRFMGKVRVKSLTNNDLF